MTVQNGPEDATLLDEASTDFEALDSIFLGRTDWPVSRIMSRQILCCPAQTPLSDAASLMTRRGCSSIVVLDGQGHPVGIWTEHDALTIDLDDPSQRSAPIRMVMSSPVHCVDSMTTLEDLVLGFRGHHVRHFVVIENDKPIGVVSQTDVIRHQGIHAYLTLRDVGSLIQTTPLTVDFSAPVSQVARLLGQNKAEAAVVLRDDVPYGIVTERDVLRMVANLPSSGIVGDVCSHPLVSAPATLPLVQAHDLMEHQRIRHLVVMDERGSVVSILSYGNILSGIELDYTRYLQATLARQHEALREGEERQRQILEATQEGFVEIDADQKIVRVNNAFCGLVGRSGKELIGQRADSLSPPEAQDDLQRQFAKIGNTNHRTYETLLQRKAGATVPVLINASTMRGRGGVVSGSFALVSDLTERHRQQARLSSLLDQVSQSNAELEAFAYVISHDLQEPLRMIASYLGLIERRYPDKLDDEGREFIGYAVDGAKRMQSMITDLLEYSRIHRYGHTFAPCDAAQCLNTALRNLMVELTDSKGVVDADVLPTVFGDAPQISRLFQCLLDNAITYRDPHRPPRIRIGAKRAEAPNQWLFWVRDNGIGIEAQFHERIFQMFQRLHARGHHGGNGIGLAVCKRIVERHQGQIWIKSTVGEGTTVYFTLPDSSDAVVDKGTA